MANAKLRTWKVLILLIIWKRLCSDATDEQRRLVKHLFDENPRYDNRVRPSAYHQEPINVTFRFNLYQIVSVDGRNQCVTLYAWVTQMWRDNTLRWNPLEYNNLSSIVVPHKQIWRPDTHLYNQVHVSLSASERHIGAILSVDPKQPFPRYANVIFRYPAIYRFSCNIDVQYFPFDVQHCRMIFASWQYDASGIDFFPEKEDIWQEDFIDTGEWTVVSAKSWRHLEYYSCCEKPYSMLYIDLILRRRPLHYLVNLVFPTLIISAIANLGFFAPSSTTGERNAKVSLGMSTLFALTVILLMIAEQMPKSSTSVPLISQFFLGILVQTSSATIATGLILFVHNRGLHRHRIPPWMRYVFFDIAALKLSLPQRTQTEIAPPNFELVSPQTTTTKNCIDTGSPPLLTRAKSRRSTRFCHFRRISKSPIMDPLKSLQWHVEKLRLMLLEKYSGRIFYTFPSNPMAREWEWLASILDRICLIGSLVTVCLLGVVFLAVGMFTTWYTV